MKDSYVVAVTSDLHAYSSRTAGKKPSSRPSHYDVENEEQQPENNPTVGLLELVKGKLSADVLLCAGDLGHQASPIGIRHAWSFLEDLRKELNASFTLGTAGNHDLDSRFLHGNADPLQTLKNLSPSFPLSDSTRADQFFARDFTWLCAPPALFVTLNSSAHHGQKSNEENHGRVTKDALSLLRTRLQGDCGASLKILLCHHHPLQHSELNLGSQDIMEGGQQLLDLLAEDLSGNWLVVHGHKHHPKVSYAAGGNNSPVVFAAGSLCSSLFLELQTSARNQFHLITFHLPTVKRLGLVGRVQSWYWHYGQGWSAAKPSTGLPHECGFGFRGRLADMAARLASLASSKLTPWSAIVSQIEEIQYLIPLDFEVLRQILQTQYNVQIVNDENGQPAEIGEIVK